MNLLISTIAIVSVCATATSAFAADAWRLSETADKLTGVVSRQAVAEITADDGHRFELTASCENADGPIGITVLSTGRGAVYKQYASNFGNNNYTKIGVRIDSGDVITTSPPLEYNNEATFYFINSTDGVNALYYFVGKYAGLAGALFNGSLLKIEPTLEDGEQPLLSVSISPNLKRYIYLCYSVPGANRQN